MLDNDEPPDWAFCSFWVALIQLALDLTQWISSV